MSRFQVIKADLPGLILLEKVLLEDERGYFKSTVLLERVV